MEKTLKLYSPRPNLNTFIIILTLFCHGLGHPSPVNQATSLMALRRAKISAQGNLIDQNWSDMKWDDSLSSDVGKIEDDLIKDGLPGQPSRVKFNQYGGYISVDDSNGRSLFYYFAEAEENPSSTPLVLWLQGGPSCSSLGMGAMAEIGPFRVNPDGSTLSLRQFAWNKVANTLFLESPAGVGFSYSNTTSDYDLSGDTRTAQDSYKFLINWFNRYPQYRTRDFYIAGESYAGFYIPELTDIIIKKNKEGGSTNRIHLKGIMIGNGIINDETDTIGFIDYHWNHALISDETHRGLLQHCTGSTINIQACNDSVMAMGEETGVLNFFDIYSPTCRPHASEITRGVYDPCEITYVHKYLNLPLVQHALHANRTNLSYTWELCSPLIKDWKDTLSTMFPIYRRLISSGIHIFLYSGDVDAVVPVTGTRYSINALNLTVIKPWKYWVDDTTKEVAGYQVVYEGLTFTTIMGAGHEIPRSQPSRALALFKMLIQKELK